MDQNQAIAAFIEEKKEEMLALWKELVNLESYVGEADHVTAVLRRVQQELEAEGFDCRLVEVGGWLGRHAGGYLGVQPAGQAHPVFRPPGYGVPGGQLGSRSLPHRRWQGLWSGGAGYEGRRGHRPVCGKGPQPHRLPADAHQGDLLRQRRKGHVGSTGDQVFLEEARGCQFAFNMETGLHTGELCVGRKGHLGCHVEVTGIESHAGNDFESGRSAIEEAAHKILAIQALTDLEEGTTVNVGVIQGGTVPNAVPGSCRFEVDIRVAKEEGRSRIKRMLPPIVEHCTVPGTSATYAFDGDLPHS